MSIPITFPDPAQTQDAPTAVDIAEQQRIALLELEDSATADLIRRWVEVQARLSPAIQAIVDEIIRRREAGERLTKADILALQQTAQLTAAANIEFEAAIDDLEPSILAHERQAIDQGSLAARVMIAAVAIDMGRRARVSTGDLTGEGLEEFVFGLQDLNATMRILRGEKFNPIAMITDVVAAGAFSGFTPESMFNAFMYEGVTQALSYFSLVMRDLLATRHRDAMRWVYRNLKPRDTGLDPDKLATTDLIRVGRDTRLTMPTGKGTDRAEDRLVIGWRRRSRRDFRVCMVCISLDGKVYQTDELMEMHPNERCFMIPVLRGMPIPDWETGREWFLKQPENIQIELMGRGRHELWKDGLVDFDDFIESTGDQQWGPGVKVRALKDMRPIAETRRGRAGTRRGGRRTRPNRPAETEGAAFNQRTGLPQRTADLEPPFPMADDLSTRPIEARSALPADFPSDDVIAQATPIQIGNSGVNTSYAVEIDGKRYFVKKVGIGQANGEVMNYEIAEAIGLKGRVPATRIVNFPDGSQGVIAEFAEGANPIGFLRNSQQREFWFDTMTPADRDRFQLLEYLNGNTDRHAYNFMVNDKGDFFIIDSGATFGVDAFESDISFDYQLDARQLNVPRAIPDQGKWLLQEMSRESIQAVIDQRTVIADIVGNGIANQSPAFIDDVSEGVQRRLDLLQSILDEMDSDGVDSYQYNEIDILLAHFARNR